jgi:hypothetical protein
VKKFLGIAVSLVLVLTTAGVAGANSLIVPFFTDGGALSSESPPQGIAAFVQLKNLEAETVIVLVEYVDSNGLDATPEEATFEIAAGTAIGFRPVRDDAGFEGAGADVPNADQVGTFTLNDGNDDGVVDSGGGGGVVISSEGRIVGASIAFNLATGAGWAYPALEMPE